MFKLTNRFWWPVDLEVPGDGQTVKRRIEVEFKRMAQGELDALRESNKSDADICAELVLGWKGVKGDEDQDLGFTAENLRLLLDQVAGARLAIVATYFDAMLGAARRKNLSGLRGIG